MPLLERLVETLRQLRSHHRRRLAFLNPPIERRRPRIQMEDYAARKAELRRLAPSNPEAAARYHQLLTYELHGLRELVATLQTTAGGRDLHECLAESRTEIERLEIEVAWCAALPTMESAADAR